MNIFSRFLGQWTADRSLHTFLSHWDVVEGTAVETYREKKVDPAAAVRYQNSRAWLLENYELFAVQLKPLWQKSLVAGSADHHDPFLFLLAVEDPAGFLDNWAALQHLPAAREALNQLILISGES